MNDVACGAPWGPGRFSRRRPPGGFEPSTGRRKMRGFTRKDRRLNESEIDAIRALLAPNRGRWAGTERRRRIDEVCSVWLVADDVKLEAVDLGGVPGEWSIVPGSDASRVLMFLHGGGYCSGSILSHRRMVTEAGRAGGMRTLAVAYRLAPEHPFPAAHDDALTAWRRLRREGYAAAHIAVGGDSAGGGAHRRADWRTQALRRGPARLRVAGFAMDRSHHIRGDADEQKRHRPAHSQGISTANWPTLTRRPEWIGGIRASRLFTPISGSAADPDPGRIGEDFARRRDALAAEAGEADAPVTLEIWPNMIHAWPVWNAASSRAAARSRTRARSFAATWRGEGLGPARSRRFALAKAAERGQAIFGPGRAREDGRIT